MKLSCVIPVYNEAENIAPLTSEIIEVMKRMNRSYEILFINDGSTDGTQQELQTIQARYPSIITVVQLRANGGKAAAYSIGLGKAKGDIVITMDGDGQDDPAEIPALLHALATGSDVVVGWKQNRQDGFIKNSTSRLFNYVTSLVTSVRLHDVNCGLKAFTRQSIKHLSPYGDLHRYIPVILQAQGFRVTEIPVHHRRRLRGKSKYGPIRFINGFLDLFTVISITKFRTRPMHLFGYIGFIFFSLGFMGGAYLTAIKILFGIAIGDRPLLLLSVMFMIMGVQIGITGLMGEYIIMASHLRPESDMIATKIDHE